MEGVKGKRHLETISHSPLVFFQIKIALFVAALLDCVTHRPSHGSTSLGWEGDWMLNQAVEAMASGVYKWPELGKSQPF